MKKNCNNCKHLEWADGDIYDESGFTCNKRLSGNVKPSRELWLLGQLCFPEYREKAKCCCELRPADHTEEDNDA